MPNNFKILIDERNANQSSFIEHLPMGAKDGLRRRSSPSIFGDQRVTHWPPWTRFLNNRLRFQTTWMVVGHVSKYGGGTTPLYRLQCSQTKMLKLIEFAAQINHGGLHALQMHTVKLQWKWMVVGHVSKYRGGTTPLYRKQCSQTNMFKLIEFAAQMNTRHWPLFTFLSQSQDHGQCGHVSWIIDSAIKQCDGWRPCFKIQMRRYNSLVLAYPFWSWECFLFAKVLNTLCSKA